MKKILWEVVREINRMYQMSRGSNDPTPSEASRKLFDMGVVAEVKWQDWRPYCLTASNRL
jgi:hypothetical protein